jgi:hypothetical protein
MVASIVPWMSSSFLSIPIYFKYSTSRKYERDRKVSTLTFVREILKMSQPILPLNLIT